MSAMEEWTPSQGDVILGGLDYFFLGEISVFGLLESLSLFWKKCQPGRTDCPFWVNVSNEDWAGKPFCRITATEDWTPFLLETVSHGGVDSLSVG
jgi:hypothetical protein